MEVTPPHKILYVITKANWGGAQKYVFDLATAAKARGYDVAVAVGGSGPLTEKLQVAGVRIIPLSLKQRRSFLGDLITFGALTSLMRIMREERPDLVHTNSAKAGGLGCLAARLVGIPRIIFTAHGWEFNAPRNVFARIGIRIFCWITVLLSHGTICVSEAIRRDAQSFPFVRSKLKVIHNGISCTERKPREEARASLLSEHAGRYWIGMVSELHPTKRIDDALRAFSMVAANYPETILVILGSGTERKRLESVIDLLGLRDRVFLLGFVADGGSYMNAFDIFMHSSRSEALGFVILEAGCAQLPVIGCRVGGIPEIIESGRNGLLTAPEDPRALADALRTLLEDKQRAAELGIALQKTVLENFSKETMLEKTFTLYNT